MAQDQEYNLDRNDDSYTPSWVEENDVQSEEVDFEVLAKEQEELKKLTSRRILKRNKFLAYVIAITHQVGFLTPIWVIFGTDHLNLSLTLALILGSTSWVTSAIFEVPMGSFADRYGRQLSVVLGLGLCAIGDLALVIFDNFAVLMIFQTFAGIGFALRSGSFEGLLHDTYEAEGDLTSYSKLSNQLLFLLNVSRIFTIPIGAWLYELRPNASLSSFTFPYIANVACYVIALLCAGLLIERRSEGEYSDPRKFKGKSLGWILFGHASSTWDEMWANKYVLKVVVILGATALIDEGNWALYQEYFRDHDISLRHSGWIYTVLFIITTIGIRAIHPLYKRYNVLWLMIAIAAIVTFDIFLMQLPLAFAVVGFVASAFVAQMPLYLYDNAIQNRMSGNHKSSALSIASMSYTIGAMIGVFGIGAVADRFGVPRAQQFYIAYGVLLIVVMAVWCYRDGFSVLPEDARATMDLDKDGTPDAVSEPLDEVAKLKP